MQAIKMQVFELCVILVLISSAATAPQNDVTFTNEDGVQVDVRVAVKELDGGTDTGQQQQGVPGAGGSASAGPTASLLSQIQPTSAQITLYDLEDFRGESRVMTIGAGDCPYAGEYWNDRASSISTPVCIVVWQHIDCRGRFVRLTPNDSDNRRLQNVGMNNEATSFQLC